MKSKKLAIYAWVTLGYNLLVVLWGVVVRATGSGAGCGSHWPSCNGEVIPTLAQADTLVEFMHRLTSGVALLLVFGLVIGFVKVYPKGHYARQGAWLSLIFIISEALVGAGLVLFGWVADDSSAGRSVVVSIHLVNTFLLLGSLALAGWWASGGPRLFVRRGLLFWALVIGMVGVLFLGVSGAITALGDTLFPAESLGAGISQDFDPNAHFLIRLRIWHPIIAIVTGFYLFFVGLLVRLVSNNPSVKNFASALIILFVIQLGAGLLNLILLAPIWMQLIHLLLADLVWISLVLLAASSFSETAEEVPVPQAV